jgi:hypothetical protein
VDAIIEQRGRIEVKGSDLDGRIIQHPLYRMTYIAAKAAGAIDWFNGSPLHAPHGPAYAIHSHHIFPSSRSTVRRASTLVIISTRNSSMKSLTAHSSPDPRTYL